MLPAPFPSRGHRHPMAQVSSIFTHSESSTLRLLDPATAPRGILPPPCRQTQPQTQPELWKAHTYQGHTHADFQVNSAAGRPAGTGHSPTCRGSREPNQRCQGESGSIHRHTNSPTSRSGSRRSARHLHCFTSAMPMALPTSYEGENNHRHEKPQNWGNCRAQPRMHSSQKLQGRVYA